MLSWRIIGVAAEHSMATSKPASISMGRSSKGHDPGHASPLAWGRADGSGWERFAPESSSREGRGDKRPMVSARRTHSQASKVPHRQPDRRNAPAIENRGQQPGTIFTPKPQLPHSNLASPDRDLARLGVLGFRQGQRQHAVFEVGADLLLVDRSTA